MSKGKDLKIIAFLEKNTAYAAADYIGQMRLSYPHNVGIISVPSTGRIGLRHLLHAFASGADGIILIEGDDSSFNQDMLRENVRQLSKELRARGIKPLRLISTTTTIPPRVLFIAFSERFPGAKFRVVVVLVVLLLALFLERWTWRRGR